MGGGRRPGIPVKPHPYAGDERLAQVLVGLRAGVRPSAVDLAEEWGVSRRTAERIIRAARSQIEDQPR
jgi:predicted DNA-binding transcriptional regulator YafY